MTHFTDIDSPVTFGRYTATATIEHDSDHDAPWQENDGHGPVSDWTTRDKQPGELILNRDRQSRRYYDFAAACKMARRDSWGVSPYSVTSEQGANGLTRLTGHFFDRANNLTAITSYWHDCPNAARSQLYALHRETMTAREYAALAAWQDYERLRDWCNDQWHYCGITVTVTAPDGESVSDSTWGMESDDSHGILTYANLMLADIMPQLSSHRVMLAADIGISWADMANFRSN